MDEDIERIDILLRANGYSCLLDKSPSHTYLSYRLGKCICINEYTIVNECNYMSLYLKFYTSDVSDIESELIDHNLGAKLSFYNTKKLLDYLINKYAMQKIARPDST